MASVNKVIIIGNVGKDPEIRKLAEDIIAAQDREISQMKAWQAKNNTP